MPREESITTIISETTGTRSEISISITGRMSGENKRKADEEPIDVEAPEPKLAKQDENEHAGVAQLAPDAQAVIEEKVTTGAVRLVASPPSACAHDEDVFHSI